MVLGQRSFGAATAFAVVVLLLAGPTWAKKDKPADGGTDAAQASKPDAKPRPASPEEQALARVREVLGCTDAEWDLFRPRVERILALQRDANAGRNPKGPRPPKDPSPKDVARAAAAMASDPSASPSVTPVKDAAKALNAALVSDDTQLAEVRARVAAARDARARCRADLTRAQDDLRGLLTIRQEAAMILMGLLD